MPNIALGQFQAGVTLDGVLVEVLIDGVTAAVGQIHLPFGARKMHPATNVQIEVRPVAYFDDDDRNRRHR